MGTGFYGDREALAADLQDPGTGFCFMENCRGKDGFTPYDFLHGYCDMFAAYLSGRYGYATESLVGRNGELIHAYCTADAGGGTLYIDIRGCTDDYVEFTREFQSPGMHMERESPDTAHIPPVSSSCWTVPCPSWTVTTGTGETRHGNDDGKARAIQD